MDKFRQMASKIIAFGFVSWKGWRFQYIIVLTVRDRLHVEFEDEGSLVPSAKRDSRKECFKRYYFSLGFLPVQNLACICFSSYVLYIVTVSTATNFELQCCLYKDQFWFRANEIIREIYFLLYILASYMYIASRVLQEQSSNEGSGIPEESLFTSPELTFETNKKCGM